MPTLSEHRERLRLVGRDPLGFLAGVVTSFRQNQGFLLAGAVAYYTLLSIVPMFVLMLIIMSQVVDREILIQASQSYLALVIPEQAGMIADQVAAFLRDWRLTGGVVFISLIFFSSLAFTVLENAMSVIFFHRVAVRRRHFLVSAIIPYIYILLLAIGMIVVSIASSVLNSVGHGALTILGSRISLSGASATVLYLLGVTGEVLLLSSLYMVLPVGRLSIEMALAGGVTATLLWEITRQVMVWYFSRLSLVNLIYGSFATVIIILLTIEAGAIIVLVGAQVIANYERLLRGDDREPGIRT